MARKDPLLWQTVKAVLYSLTGIEATPPAQFARDIREWSRRMVTLQQYHYQAPGSSLPDDLSLADDYPKINHQVEREIAAFGRSPLITVIVPVYANASEILVTATLASIARQFYQQTEIYILTDGEAGKLEQMAAPIFLTSQSVKINHFENLSTNLALALNEVLHACSGEFLAFVSAADTISRNALLEVVRAINASPNVNLFYSDEGRKAADYSIRVLHKPGWSRDLFYSLNYTQNLLCLNKEVCLLGGGFHGRFESDLKYDVILRIIEQRGTIQHIPKVLYQEEAVYKSWPEEYNADQSLQLQKNALESHLRRLNIEADVSSGVINGSFRVRRHIERREKVSIIIPTRDKINLLARCIESVESKSTYENYEIIIIDNGSIEAATAEYFAKTKHKVIRNDEQFNFSRLNNFGSEYARGEHLLFLNNDTEVIAPGWLEAMLEHSQRAEVGAVGAKLLYANGMIQHAGMVLGGPWIASQIDRLAEMHDHGASGFADVIRNVACVTGSCLMMRTSVFREVGGFDESLVITYNDVDLCLKARSRGYLVVYTPYALLYHHEGVSRLKEGEQELARIELSLNGESSVHMLPVPRGQAREIEEFCSRWRTFIENDANYTPSLES